MEAKIIKLEIADFTLLKVLLSYTIALLGTKSSFGSLEVVELCKKFFQ